MRFTDAGPIRAHEGPAGYHRPVSNPSEDNTAHLARVLQEIEHAAEQAAGSLNERDRLVAEAKALGGSHRQIASRADLSHAADVQPIKQQITPAAREPLLDAD
ncbi:hypothetical protein [Amycolatopsis rifamycinica]|uniref:Uncharacterized protein n=1 Tax=Amycolatopsis rifamycinica TaxID=287986 RepID=A0A066U2U1_9PSEU|nr:hypothetical protein [Amycolatopsis rifamycinica]KDN21746.1 hypothetical protein DV20_12500 [Amycolatopsis rifamycinica]